MKTKFLLTLLAFNGLLFGTNSAFAATPASIGNNQYSANLSQTIAKSIDLDGSYHSLIESAIDRALLAQNQDTSNKERVIRGKVAAPNPHPIINGKIAQPTPSPSNPPVIINGIIKKVDPETKPTGDRNPKINGVIINPDRR
jgi:hypothetical protein